MLCTSFVQPLVFWHARNAHLQVTDGSLVLSAVLMGMMSCGITGRMRLPPAGTEHTTVRCFKLLAADTQRDPNRMMLHMKIYAQLCDMWHQVTSVLRWPACSTGCVVPWHGHTSLPYAEPGGQDSPVHLCSNATRGNPPAASKSSTPLMARNLYGSCVSLMPSKNMGR